MYAQLHLELQEMKLRSAARQLNYAGISCHLPALTSSPLPSPLLHVRFRFDWLADCLPRLSADNCSPWPLAPPRRATVAAASLPVAISGVIAGHEGVIE